MPSTKRTAEAGRFLEQWSNEYRIRVDLPLNQLHRRIARCVAQTESVSPGNRDAVSTDVVICVHNALDDVRACLESVRIAIERRSARLILVDDGSDRETADYLDAWIRGRGNVAMERHTVSLGYVHAANRGLHMSDADVTVLLNSDCVVPEAWLDCLLETFAHQKDVGIVSPLSNAASYQSVPHVRDEIGEWSLNPELSRLDFQVIARTIATLSYRLFPSVPVANGFCLAIKNEVLRDVGYLDTESFPRGYGEETDFCIRARRAGYTVAIADQAYVYHAKSKSFSHPVRRRLSDEGMTNLRRKYGASTIDELVYFLETDGRLDPLRATLVRHLGATTESLA